MIKSLLFPPLSIHALLQLVFLLLFLLLFLCVLVRLCRSAFFSTEWSACVCGCGQKREKRYVRGDDFLSPSFLLVDDQQQDDVDDSDARRIENPHSTRL